MPRTKKAAVVRAEVRVCSNITQALGLKTNAPKSTISARPLLRTYPTGCCIKALAIKIHKADSELPSATSQITATCSFLESLSQPKIHKPKKVDSRKNATR